MILHGQLCLLRKTWISEELTVGSDSYVSLLKPAPADDGGGDEGPATTSWRVRR